jgi:NAD(P)-dependent dehydrogenase (short-subunit alcohol dehydrogenase family)
LARDLAADGWTLIIDGRDPVSLGLAAGELGRATGVRAVAGNVANDEHRRALASVARDIGRIDLVVHNASELGPSPLPKLLDHPIDALREVYEVNVVAPVALTQALRPWLAPDATIIAVTSDAAVEPYEGWAGYGSSKAALDHAFAVLAAEEPQWRVYRVDPGDLRTAMHQAAFPDEDISDRPLPEVRVPALRALLDGDYPSGRYVAADLSHEEVSA